MDRILALSSLIFGTVLFWMRPRLGRTARVRWDELFPHYGFPGGLWNAALLALACFAIAFGALIVLNILHFW